MVVGLERQLLELLVGVVLAVVESSNLCDFAGPEDVLRSFHC